MTKTQVAEAPNGIREFTPAEKSRIQTLKKSINIQDATAVLKYGSEVQKNIAEFADGILGLVRNKDSGHVGELLGDLIGGIRSINVSQLSYKKPGVLGRFLSGLFDKAQEFISRYEKVGSQIDSIQQKLGVTQEQLNRDITLMEGLFERSVAYFKELDLFIAAGEERLEEVRRDELPKLQQRAGGQDPLARQALSDLHDKMERFERKLHDLKLSRNVTLQSLPQIRIIQHNNQQLAEKIQSSIVNTIPLWKQQILIALSLYRQKVALDVQNNVTNTTNEILTKNAELLKTNSVEVARANERGIVDIATLKKTQADLIETIEQTIAIQQEGRRNREAAEKDLLEMERELHASLTSKRGT